MNNSEKNVWMFVRTSFISTSKYYPEYQCEHTSTLERAVSCFHMWFPKVDLGNVFSRFKAQNCCYFWDLVACESKKNLTIFPTSLIKKLLFRHISGNFLIMLLITIASLFLSSNKLDSIFNCDTNLLMTLSLLLISNKKILQLVGC